MKKILCIFLLTLLFAGCSAKENPNAKNFENNKFNILTLFSSFSESKDRVWVGTFQLVFNDVKNNLVKHNIEFVGEKPSDELKKLNNEEFKADMLDENSYYKRYGEKSPKEKEEIKKALMKKFNTQSSIIDTLDWSEGSGLYAYAMIKKDFDFLREFDKLGSFSFNNSKEKYDFFGIKNNSDDILNKNVRVLFYNNENDFAVQLITKINDTVYLYKTDSSNSFDKIYEDLKAKKQKYKGDVSFGELDTLKVPNLKFSAMRMYPELCNKQIKDSTFKISTALETIEMELNSKGGKVKSEAVIMLDNALAVSDYKKPRHFDFDKTFVIFLIDKDKKDPYLALQIENLSKFLK